MKYIVNRVKVSKVPLSTRDTPYQRWTAWYQILSEDKNDDDYIP